MEKSTARRLDIGARAFQPAQPAQRDVALTADSGERHGLTLEARRDLEIQVSADVETHQLDQLAVVLGAGLKASVIGECQRADFNPYARLVIPDPVADDGALTERSVLAPQLRALADVQTQPATGELADLERQRKIKTQHHLQVQRVARLLREHA